MTKKPMNTSYIEKMTPSKKVRACFLAIHYLICVTFLYLYCFHGISAFECFACITTVNNVFNGYEVKPFELFSAIKKAVFGDDSFDESNSDEK